MGVQRSWFGNSKPNSKRSNLFRAEQTLLSKLMKEKELLEHRYSQRRLALQRQSQNYGPFVEPSTEVLKSEVKDLRSKLTALDEHIAPLARHSSQLQNERWGLLMRAGNEKSPARASSRTLR